jgi:predicted phage terminase large subunit-like protein
MQIFDIDKITFVREEQIDKAVGQMLCVFDPSKGKQHNDYPAVWWVHYYNDRLTFFDAIDKKIELTEMIQMIANRNKIHGCRSILFEENNAYLLEEAFLRVHDNIGWKVSIETKRHSAGNSKHERILSIQPELYSGYVQFLNNYEDKYPEAMNQIIFYPVYGHDDFPDAAQMAIEYFRKPKFQFIRYEETL